jgi:hypothetical protein
MRRLERTTCFLRLSSSGDDERAQMKGTLFMRSRDENKRIFLEAVGCFGVMALVLAGAVAAFLFLYPLAKYSYHYWVG